MPDGQETRVVDPTTGGAKGSKLARFDLVPPGPMLELAEHYGKGSLKYEDRNWEKGYRWGLSIAALERHLNAFKAGEDFDEETKSKHVIAVAWHAVALAEFMETHPELDDRSTSRRDVINERMRAAVVGYERYDEEYDEDEFPLPPPSYTESDLFRVDL